MENKISLQKIFESINESVIVNRKKLPYDKLAFNVFTNLKSETIVELIEKLHLKIESLMDCSILTYKNTDLVSYIGLDFKISLRGTFPDRLIEKEIVDDKYEVYFRITRFDSQWRKFENPNEYGLLVTVKFLDQSEMPKELFEEIV